MVHHPSVMKGRELSTFPAERCQYVLASCVTQDLIQSQPRYPLEVSDVAADQFQVVMDGGGGNLEVSIGEHLAGFFELSPNLPVNAGDGHIIWQGCNGGEYPLLNVG